MRAARRLRQIVPGRRRPITINVLLTISSERFENGKTRLGSRCNSFDKDAVAMLKLVAILAGLIFTISASAQEPTGQFGDRHTEFHGWYQSLKRPTDGASCCSDQDCRPTRWRQLHAQVEVLVNGKWCGVPVEKILPMSAPDGGAHICTPRIPTGTDPCAAPIFCVVIGSQS